MSSKKFFSNKIVFLLAFFLIFFTISQVRAETETKTEKAVYFYDDFFVEKIETVPVKVAVGQSCVVKVKVKNNGNRAWFTSKGLSSFKYSLENFEFAGMNYTTPTFSTMIMPGDYADYTFKGKFTQAGKNKVYLKVDVINEVTEEKPDSEGKAINLEGNNELNGEVDVLSADDLDIGVYSIVATSSTKTYNVDHLTTYEDVNIGVTLINNGQMSVISWTPFESANVKAGAPNFALKSTNHDNYPSADNPLDSGEKFTYYYKGSFVDNAKGEKVFDFLFDKDQVLPDKNRVNNATSTKFFVSYLQSEAEDFNFYDLKAYPISSTSVRLDWKTDQDTKGIAIYRLGANGGDITFADGDTYKKEHSVTMTGMEQGRDYYVMADGLVGSTTKRSELKPFRSSLDDKISLVGEPSVSLDMASRTATFSWETNLLGNSYVYYRRVGDTGYNNVSNETKVLQHLLTVKNLEVKEYEYYVKSFSTNGASSTDGIRKFKLATSTDSASTIVGVPAIQATSTVLALKSEEKMILSITNDALYNRLRGRIILKVEDRGKAFYVDPKEKKMYYLGLASDAFAVMRSKGVGISNSLLSKIEPADAKLADAKPNYNKEFANMHKGKIFLQVQAKGEAWYVNPVDAKKYYLGRPEDAYAVMRKLGLGVNNATFVALGVAK